jgi:endonuclease G, mitochondrial
LERIIGRSDIFPVNFLARGERAAKAVGRLNVITTYGISLGFGTGFLVAPGLLLTNHHVLSEQALIAKSQILFDYEFDADNSMKRTEQFSFTPEIFLTSKELDFTFVSVAPVGKSGCQLAEFGSLVLVPESGKAVKREFVSIIQHANGLPKQIAMRDSQILGRKEHYIYYTTDTNPGSSGAPVVNDEWLPVALHHRSVPDLHKPMSYVCNRGIRISSIFDHLNAAARRHSDQAIKVLQLLQPDRVSTARTTVGFGSKTGAGTEEKYLEPFHESFEVPRSGYNPNFLGTAVPLPTLKDPNTAAKRIDNGSHILTYDHFSVVMHKKRRLALFTASNVDARPSKKKPDPDEDYSRDGLGGLGKNDREKWFEDSRLPSIHQLPDRFFESDDKAFDKGHLVRREDVTWGDSYDEIRRANGDTFHLTNCSPQVAGFNRSNLNGLWGELENIVLKQAKTEKYCVFAGPVLDLSDQSFRGRDVTGETLVQIPAKYWKLVVARENGQLKSFAFLLEQDLSEVPLEFQVNAEWRTRMISVPELEMLVRHFSFPAVIRNSDQFETGHNELLRSMYAYSGETASALKMVAHHAPLPSKEISSEVRP